MSTSRDDILGRVTAALATLPERAALPDWETEMAVARKLVEHRDPVDVFAERIKLVNGRAVDNAGQLATILRDGGWMHGYCDPELVGWLAPALGAGFTIETEFDRSRVDDYTFGITRAAGAIAETGTIILDDTTTSRRLAALAPWVHVAVVPRTKIHATLADAALHLGPDPNIIWVTGPSKTADVEGILIEGVHGPGVQLALMV